MPGRLDAEYIGADDKKHTPVMLHRAILGSLERFIGILIEEHAGKFPFWLAPTQVVVCNISDSQADYVQKITEKMQAAGFRVESDLRNEKVGYKVRAHTLQRVPFILVVGDREKEENTVSVRTRGGDNLGVKTVDEWIAEMQTMTNSYQ
jgi:threonyl-tRNA synthetase